MTRLRKILKCGVTIAVAVLIFIIFFAPTSREPYIRNVPLLITLITIIIVVLVIKIVRIIFHVYRIKFSLIKCGFASAILRLETECCYICAERAGETYEICAVVSKKQVRYHFESIEKNRDLQEV